MANITSKEKNRVEKMELNRELKWSEIRKLEREVEEKQKFYKMQHEQWLREEGKINRLLNIDDSSLKYDYFFIYFFLSQV